GGGTACGMTVGECVPGATICRSGHLVCEGGQGPTAEVCDGLENNCDGHADENIPTAGPCGSSVGECRPGVLRCLAGHFVCDGERGPRAEECNCRDDDCNGTLADVSDGGHTIVR